MKPELYNYDATVERVIDADTVVCNLDLGFGVWMRKVSVRVLGINAPEISGKERPEGLVAKARVVELLPPGTKVTVCSRELGKYGRPVGHIRFNLPVPPGDGLPPEHSGEFITDLATMLVSEGLAVYRTY